MRRTAYALVAFIALEYFAPLKTSLLVLVTLFCTVELVGLIVLHRMGQRRPPTQTAPRHPQRLQASH
jgi:hypothetical protein